MMLSIIRISIGILFIFSGILKMTDLISFHDTIELFNILPRQFINAATIFIPSAELICGLWLVLNIFKKGSITILIGLLTLFVIAVGISLIRGSEYDCGCFGPLQIFNSISINKILLNICLAGLLTLVFYKEKVKIDIHEQFKVVMTYSLFIAFIINIPFNNTNLEHIIIGKNIKKIDFNEALELIEKENAVLFDARAPERYKKEHVPGALSLPFFKFNEYYEKYKNFDKNRLVLVYCDALDCTAAQRVAYKLVGRSFINVFIIGEGWEGWKKLK